MFSDLDAAIESGLRGCRGPQSFRLGDSDIAHCAQHQRRAASHTLFTHADRLEPLGASTATERLSRFVLPDPVLAEGIP